MSMPFFNLVISLINFCTADYVLSFSYRKLLTVFQSTDFYDFIIVYT